MQRKVCAAAAAAAAGVCLERQQGCICSKCWRCVQQCADIACAATRAVAFSSAAQQASQAAEAVMQADPERTISTHGSNAGQRTLSVDTSHLLQPEEAP